MTLRMRKMGVGLLCGLILAVGIDVARKSRPVHCFPGVDWLRKVPKEAGFDANRLAQFSRRAGGHGVIVRNGYIIHEWGRTDVAMDAASSMKPFFTHWTLMAIQAGAIGSLDDRIEKWMPEIADLNPALGHKDRDITFRHLLSQTSGYGLTEKPGEAFAYNDVGTGLLADVLFRRVLRCAPGQEDDVLRGSWLGEAIGFRHRPTLLHPDYPFGRLHVSVQDMARFALLYLRRGQWQGKQIVRPDLFEMAMSFSLPENLPRTRDEEGAEYYADIDSIGGGFNQKNHLGCLGYFWWFNRRTPDGRRLLPDAPPGLFMGIGYGGRFAMIIIPECDLVAIWFDVHPKEEWSPFDQIGRMRVNAMVRELLEAQLVRQIKYPYCDSR